MAANVRVLYIQYTNPGMYPPLEHSSRLLAQAGAQVQVLGVAAPDTGNLKFATHPGVMVHTLPYAAPGWRQKVHYGWYLFWVLSRVIRWRPTWVYASDPLVAPIAWLLTFWPRLHVLYHEHDAPAPSNSAFMRGILALRRQVVRRARLVVVPNAVRGAALARESSTTRPINTVWNCPELSNIQPQRQREAGPLRLIYQGSIVPPRLPITILEANGATYLPD